MKLIAYNNSVWASSKMAYIIGISLIILVLSLFVRHPLYGQDYVPKISKTKDTTQIGNVDSIDQLVVVAKGKPSSTKQSVPIQTMDKKHFEAYGIQNLYEAVRTFSGVTLKDYGGIGGVKTVSVRSMGSQHTVVSYDGVAVSDAQTGQIDLGKFPLDNVEMVSLSIGISDDIFQTAKMFASASALNITTSKPIFAKSGTNVQAQMKLASFGTYNPYIMVQQRLSDRWGVSVNGDWLSSRGDYPFSLKVGDKVEEFRRLNSEVESVRGEVNLYGNLKRGGEIIIKGNYLYSDRALPGSVVYYKQEAKEWLWDRNGFVSASYKKKFSSKFSLMTNMKYTYMWNHYLIKDMIYKNGKDETFYTQNEGYVSVAGMYSPMETLKFTFAQDVAFNDLDATMVNFVYPQRVTSLSALAGQYQTQRVTLTTSVVSTYITESVKVGTPAEDKFRLSPAVSVSYKLFDEYNWRVRFSYKDAFRAPTFNDLYYSRVGNKSLKPEKSSQFNLGLTFSGALWEDVIKYVSLSLDGYHNKIKDKIVAIPTLFIWRMMNIGKVNMSGLDLNSSAHISLPHMMSLIVNLNYSFQHAVNVTDPESKTYKHQIPYTPQHSGSFSLSWENPWVNFSYLCTVVGERFSFPQNTKANLIPSYQDHSVSLSRDFAFKWGALKLMAEVLNIFDVNYEVVKFYPMPGRSYRITLKYNY